MFTWKLASSRRSNICNHQYSGCYRSLPHSLCCPCLGTELCHFKSDRDWMSERKWYQDWGDNRLPENENEHPALWWKDEGSEETTVQSHLLRSGWRGGGKRGKNRPFCGMALSFVCLFLFREPRWTTLAIQLRGKRQGRGEQAKALAQSGDKGSFGSSLGLHGGCCCALANPRQLSLILPPVFSYDYSNRILQTNYLLPALCRNCVFLKIRPGTFFFLIPS